ncbi:hypothetical protein VPHK469_0173 [Vibrio phage K469]
MRSNTGCHALVVVIVEVTYCSLRLTLPFLWVYG